MNQRHPDMGRRTGRGGTAVLLAQVLKLIIQTAATAVMARMLTPSDYGIIAMVTVVTGCVGLLKDMGLSVSVIQSPEITAAEINSLFWINIVIGLLLTVEGILLAPLLAMFYGKPEVRGICAILSISFLINSLTAQQSALLQRNLQFRCLATIDLASVAVAAVVGTLLAWRHWGYWALVASLLAGQATALPLVWYCFRWMPGRPSISEAARHIRFGGAATVGGVCAYIVRNLDNFLLGKYASQTALGVYSKAYSLLLLPMQLLSGPLSTVMLPVLSRLQDDELRFKHYYLQAIRLLAFAGMPLVGCLVVVAPEIVQIILGPRWHESATLFRLMSLGAWLGTFNIAIGWLLTSTGKINRLLQISLLSAGLFAMGFIAALPWGARGMAVAFSVCYLVLNLGILTFGFRGTPVTARGFVQTITFPALASVICSLVGLWIANQIAGGPWSRLIGLSTLIFGLYALCGISFRWGRAEMKETMGTLRKIASQFQTINPLQTQDELP
jgi:PST family polysaccharide transporter